MPVSFISMCCNNIKWVHKTWQVYNQETEMVFKGRFLRFNVDDSYNRNMKSVTLVINLGMCNNFTTRFISTIGGGIFGGGAWPRPFQCVNYLQNTI